MSVRVIVTGGTFEKQYDALKGELTFKDSHLPRILELVRCTAPVVLEVNQLIDSLHMQAADRQRVLAACILVGALYLHRSFSRAGVSFLAQGIHPFLIGAICLPFAARGWAVKTMGWTLLALVMVLTWFSVVTVSPYYQMASADKGVFTELKVDRDRLNVFRSTAELVTKRMPYLNGG